VSAKAKGASAKGKGLTTEERAELLRVARTSLEVHLAGRGPYQPNPTTPTLAEHRGAFVTLHRARDGELRGCVGMMRSEESLVRTVARMAVSAGVDDGRFMPVTPEELSELQIEISALGSLKPIRPDDVEIGRHGLLISHRGHRGVLLPQVPVEHEWDRETFLEHTCIKAGLPPEAWREDDADLLGFTAEVFGDEMKPGRSS
jgi:AmmeMemoRadiSam system protein A